MPDIPAAVHIVVGAVGHQELIPLHVGQIQPAVGLKALNVLQRNIGAVLAVIVVAGHHGGGVGQLHLDLAHSKISVSVGGSLSVLGVHIHIDVLKAEGGIAGFRGTGVLQLNLIEAAAASLIEYSVQLAVCKAERLIALAVVQIQLHAGHVGGIFSIQNSYDRSIRVMEGLPVNSADRNRLVPLKEELCPCDIVISIVRLALDHRLHSGLRQMVLEGQGVAELIVPLSIWRVHSGQGPDGQGAHHHTEHHEKGQRLFAHSCQHAHSPSSHCAGSF